MLEGGNYGDFDLMAKSGFDYQFPENVTIASADPSNPAVFSSVDIREGANMTFDGIMFDYEFKEGTPIWVKPFIFSDCENITIRNSTFDGDVASGVSEEADGFGYGIGLTIRGCNGTTIENNEIFGFHRGMTMGNGDDAVVRGNEVHSIRSDGLNFSQMQGVLIEDNYIHDFENSEASADHSDMIQFWTNNATRPTTDVIIRNNTLDIGDGDSTQSIFMRNDLVDRGFAGTEMYYQNVLIEGNVITNAHAHGISVGEANGLIIRNNSVLHSDGGAADGLDRASEIPRINVAGDSTNVTITNNAVSAITGYSGQDDWESRYNAFVQDQSPLDPGYYGDVFISSSLTAENGQHSFIALPGGMLTSLNAGAPSTLNGTESDDRLAHFQVLASPDDASLRVFDARNTIEGFDSLPAGTEFIWNFGDGTSATGPVVQHHYGAGHHEATLTVRLPDQTESTETAIVSVAGGDVLSFSAGTGFQAHGYGISTALDVEGVSEGIVIAEEGVALSIDRDNVTQIMESDDFSISWSMTAAEAGQDGELFRIHNSFTAEVDRDGELYFRLFPTDGPMIELRTRDAGLDDTSSHSISVVAGDGIVTVLVDGEALAVAEFTGGLRATGDANLNFGNGWSGNNFASTITDFEITAHEDDFAEGSGTSSSGSGASTASEAQAAAEAAADAIAEAEAEEQAPEETPQEPVVEVVTPTPSPAPAPETDVAAIDPTQADSGPDLNGEPEPEAAWAFDGDDVLIPADIKMKGGGEMVLDGQEVTLSLSGDGQSANLGQLAEYNDTDQLGFSVDFQRDSTDGNVRLVWNHLKVGLTLVNDGLRVQVATEDDGFKSFDARNLGLSDTDMHNITVMVDTEADRLQVVLDGDVVMDVNDDDFELDVARDRGWQLGGAWHSMLDGTITDFELGDRFEFLEQEEEAIA
ncbi:hypothetical protein AB838_06935 [Rhodobacteraceae bacterium (ex Bugula neritina AB1)]|nr:hypothetical protein AB838_06935 [Rhodobacteraceae bacterium (ex Bugula neritina AB1)]